MDDCRLVELTIGGGAGAFEQLVRKYHGPLIASAYHLVGNMEDAQDLAQETLIEAYKRLPSLRESAKLRSWLFAILRNKCIRFVHRRPNEVPLERCEAELATPASYSDGDILEIISRLPLSDREVLSARYLQELGFEELAELLDTSVNAVQMRCSRARQRLRQLLLQADEEETRTLMRRTMGAIMAGGISDTFVHRVLTEVTPMIHVPTAGHVPASPLTTPLHALPHFAGWYITAGVTTLLMVAGAGMIFMQHMQHGMFPHPTLPPVCIAAAAPSSATPPALYAATQSPPPAPPAPEPAVTVPPHKKHRTVHHTKTAPAAKAPVKTARIVPTIAVFPGQMHFRYKIQVLHQPFPKEYVKQRIAQLQHEKPTDWKQQLVYWNNTRTAVSSDKEPAEQLPDWGVDYWIEQPAKFRWDPDRGLVEASDGQKLTVLSQIEPKKLPVGSMQIVPVGLPGKAFYFGVTVENEPYLGYQQPGKYYHSMQHDTITKTKDGFTERCQVPHQYRISNGKPEMENMTLNYDRQGRLIRLERENDDEVYEFRDFVRFSPTSYYPRVVVRSRWSEALPENPPPQIDEIITYTVENADTNTLDRSGRLFHQLPAQSHRSARLPLPARERNRTGLHDVYLRWSRQYRCGEQENLCRSITRQAG